jgi:homoserine dehydrogenase
LKKVNVAIMGFGTVGTGVYKVLEKEKKNIEEKEGISLNIVKVYSRHFHYNIPDILKVYSVDDISEDPDIDIVIETIGGIEPTKDLVLQCLNSGKTVVTANKKMIAMYWPELEEAAKKTGAGLYFEASVGAGIPILRTIDDSLQANTISSVEAIINGTTNYILTKMYLEGRDYDDVLREAQELGYAEADPSADVDGYDAMYKLAILASKAFHTRIPIDRIYMEGISGIKKKDIQFASDFGYVIKLLAIARKNGKKIELRVHPAMISKQHPLANVLDSYNAILLNGNAIGDIMVYGRGAGDFPTASAVLSDVVYAAQKTKHKYASFKNNMGELSEELEFNTNWQNPFYIRLDLLERPGVLSKVTKIMGDHNISLNLVMQKGLKKEAATIVFLTYPSNEKDVQAAIQELKLSEVVKKVSAVIRIIED